MEKNGNTLETGDKVKRTGTEGKVASNAGEIVGADPQMERFGVKWADGVVSWHGVDELEPADT